MQARYTVIIYQDAQGKQPFIRWLSKLTDIQAIGRIDARIQRMADGNVGDSKSLGGGLFELRIDCGAGYRVYYCFEGTKIVLLLCAGDKRTQTRDIEKAAEYKADFEGRKL